MITRALCILAVIGTIARLDATANATGGERGIEFDKLIKLYLLPIKTPQNVLGWDTGSMPNTPIIWEHDGIKDCEPDIQKEYGSWACRIGNVIITFQGKPTYTVLGRTIQPGRWKITLVGARAGVFYVLINTDTMQSDHELLKAAANKPGSGIKIISIKKCGNESTGSELMRISVTGMQPAFIRQSWSCGSGGCSDDYVLTAPIESTENVEQKLMGPTSCMQ